jgi:anti-repressor protein
MTKQLIKIIINEHGRKLVSARELHEFLGLSKRFSAWFDTYAKNDDYGFIEDEDFTSVTTSTVVNNGANRELQDYAISIDMAKELSMLSKSKKGKEARKYFIECEKQLSEISKKALLLEQIYNGGQEGILASKKLTELEVKEATTPLLEKIEEDKPLVEFGNQVLKSADNILVRELSKLAFEQGIDIGEKKLYKKLREWKYIMQGCTEPYQSAMNQGLFVVEEKSINTPYGVKLTKTTKVTPKGQVFIIEKLRKEVSK